MKIAFIHNEKKITTGANYINDLISAKLQSKGLEVKHFYPTQDLFSAPTNLKGIANILFFYSLLEHREEILKCDLIQGTTYTPLTFLPFGIPIVSHFGSTTQGFLDAVPKADKFDPASKKIWDELFKQGVIKEKDLSTRRPLRDIAEIEKFVGIRSAAVVATSELVSKELITQGVPAKKVSVIHNAIEDYWFKHALQVNLKKPHIVFLGRLGNDCFNLKLKGFDRLVHLYRRFPETPKVTFGITTNEKIKAYLNKNVSHHYFLANVIKSNLPKFLNPLRGSILFISSRYEGFSLSLIEGMSQGLIPIVYPVGVAGEIIKNGINGFLVKNQNQALDAAEKILGDARLRRRMSQQARKSAEQFNADYMTDQFVELYEKILKKKVARPQSVKSERFSFRNFLRLKK
ncbi:MAG TPA: glycosyltransferase family 4 protein [Patescibacteria group bacterium]|nr:glycosyltransferase family 4 protein [Patescibacteria group bacterium]